MKTDPWKGNRLRISPSIESSIDQHIRDLVEEYGLWKDPGRPPSQQDLQRGLPFDGGTRQLSLSMFPMDPFEVLQRFDEDAGLQVMADTRRDQHGQAILACSRRVLDNMGLVTILFVWGEHFDEEELTPLGRYGALRELARLIWAKVVGRPLLSSFGETEMTPEVHPGDFIAPGFFRDPLNRWAMALACPPMEFRMLMTDVWGALPVSRATVHADEPILADQAQIAEGLFMSKRHGDRTVADIFGVSAHAILGWSRHLGLIDW